MDWSQILPHPGAGYVQVHPAARYVAGGRRVGPTSGGFRRVERGHWALPNGSWVPNPGMTARERLIRSLVGPRAVAQTMGPQMEPGMQAPHQNVPDVSAFTGELQAVQDSILQALAAAAARRNQHYLT